VNAGLFVPALIPFTFHWYAGLLPPLTGVAVKVTGVPRHTGLAEAKMLTETGRNGETVIVITFELAGFPLVHPALDVRMQDTRSLLTGVYEKVALFVPALTPLTFHW